MQCLMLVGCCAESGWSKSKERNRRPTLEELDQLMEYFFEREARGK
ncbi:hypothetical protein SAMN03159473_00760 [Pseudomonas sp. NFACC52]|nr:hypothetical protein SAMN03159481_00762 [Pseudomonas sp. NFACC56-3]SFK21434.1 hypothetical protein SAMN03159473_00760 [Pseudomonas sp. NFACC52]